jgi:hypothetical protein
MSDEPMSSTSHAPGIDARSTSRGASSPVGPTLLSAISLVGQTLLWPSFIHAACSIESSLRVASC